MARYILRSIMWLLPPLRGPPPHIKQSLMYEGGKQADILNNRHNLSLKFLTLGLHPRYLIFRKDENKNGTRN